MKKVFLFLTFIAFLTPSVLTAQTTTKINIARQVVLTIPQASTVGGQISVIVDSSGKKVARLINVTDFAQNSEVIKGETVNVTYNVAATGNTGLSNRLVKMTVSGVTTYCVVDKIGNRIDFAKDVDFSVVNSRIDSSNNNINYVNGRADSLKTAINAKTLSISGQNLTISGGNTVTLPFSAADSSFKMVGTNAKGASSALASLTTGTNNTAIGDSALATITTSSQNVAIGSKTLKNYTASGRGTTNTAIGFSALYSMTTGGNNTAIGGNALYSTTIGSRNIAIGVSSNFENILGNANVGIGNFSLWKKVTGSDNTAIGDYALQSMTDGGNNTAIGSNAGKYQLGGSNNIVIGASIDVSNLNGSNQLNIGNWITGNNGEITIPNTLTVQKFTATAIPVYADDAAADVDSTLASGSFYRITGSRVLYQKP